MIKIGVIGIGSMGKNHVRVCSELPDVDLVGISDINRDAAKVVAKRFNTKTYNSYKTLLNLVDAVIIATPTTTHYDLVNHAFSHGKHVLVEKPICDNITNAEDIVKKAEDKKLVLAVGHIERHNPVVDFMKKSINNKRFGEIISINSKRVSNLPGRIKDVGVILDFSIHDIDVMRFLSGEIKSVYAKAGIFNKNIKYEDHAVILLNFENDVCGMIDVNWLTPIKIRRLFLTCSEQFVEMDYINQSVTMSSSSLKVVDEMDLYNVPMQFRTNHISLEKKEPLRNEIQDFINVIKNCKQPLASGYDGLMALRIAKSAIKSFKTGEVIKL